MRSRAFVLLVDDDEDLLPMMALELKDGFSVLEASSYERALALFAQVDPIAAVVADLRLLPGDRSGIDLLSVVAQRAPQCGRVLISGTPDGEEIHLALRDGAVHRFLHKPWPLGALLDEVLEARTRAAIRYGTGAPGENPVMGCDGPDAGVATSPSVGPGLSGVTSRPVLELAGCAVTHDRTGRRRR